MKRMMSMRSSIASGHTMRRPAPNHHAFKVRSTYCSANGRMCDHPVRGENDRVSASLYVQDGKSIYQRERHQEKQQQKRHAKSASCMRSAMASKLALSYHDENEQVEADLAKERMLDAMAAEEEERMLMGIDDVLLEDVEEEEEKERAQGAFGGAGGSSSSSSSEVVVFGS